MASDHHSSITSIFMGTVGSAVAFGVEMDLHPVLSFAIKVLAASIVGIVTGFSTFVGSKLAAKWLKPPSA
jgi:hypothetical protein